MPRDKTDNLDILAVPYSISCGSKDVFGVCSKLFYPSVTLLGIWLREPWLENFLLESCELDPSRRKVGRSWKFEILFMIWIFVCLNSFSCLAVQIITHSRHTSVGFASYFNPEIFFHQWMSRKLPNAMCIMLKISDNLNKIFTTYHRWWSIAVYLILY